ncbi:glycosyl transferase [Pontibacillus halophilus JSM 076056 = DSM 19796]|uniref:Glycosyl transferase n=1 Tax=Pontibacillus halophilus JSM 076056 = DSM 19796 TaxID=1385510 RepID=A0A0A5GGG8_9BACI|nr:glycosyltransferase [Pontibacillus halophilus]KGX91074.1 glycosyl transferase [Pontibacillus halophilus JSM 076056 = DSM 19796]
MNPLVSVVTPVFNGERYLYDCVQSVLKQTYSNWEMILVNDASTDGTAHLLEDLSKDDKRIKPVSLMYNRGAAYARNEAIRRANGKYVAFLDCDDYWHPDKLRKQIQFMEQYHHPFTYTNYALVNERGELLEEMTLSPTLTYRDLLKRNSIGCLTVILNREHFHELHMPSIGHEDYATWLQCLKEIDGAYGLEESLASFRVRKQSLSSNRWKGLKWRWGVYRYQRLNYVQSCYYMVSHTLQSKLR